METFRYFMLGFGIISFFAIFMWDAIVDQIEFNKFMEAKKAKK